MNKGNKVLLTVMAVALLGLTSNVKTASALPITFANAVGNAIVFSGGADDTAGVHDTFLTLKDGTAADAAFNLGTISFSGGPFVIGAVSPAGAGVEVASVSGMGTMVLDFGGTDKLTGDFVTGQIKTDGSSGSFNTGGTLNYTNLTCSFGGGCANADLAELLASSLGGEATINFTFNPAVSLTELDDLTNGNIKQTSYSGSVTVPEPGALILMGAGLIGLFGIRKKFQGNA